MFALAFFLTILIVQKTHCFYLTTSNIPETTNADLITTTYAIVTGTNLEVTESAFGIAELIYGAGAELTTPLPEVLAAEYGQTTTVQFLISTAIPFTATNYVVTSTSYDDYDDYYYY